MQRLAKTAAGAPVLTRAVAPVLTGAAVAAQTALSSLPPPYSPGSTNQGLWVERGVIWLMPAAFPIGFTDTNSMQTFLLPNNLAPLGFKPYSYPADAPFSASSMPAVVGLALGYGVIVWPLLTAMPFVGTFLTHVPQVAAPFIDPGLAQKFPAASPQGVQSFSAKYLLFSEIGPFSPGLMYGSAIEFCAMSFG